LPQSQWAVLIRDHHEGYIDWATYEANQMRLATNPSFDFSDSRNPHQRWVSAIFGGYHVAM
jgi:hypothetical protein